MADEKQGDAGFTDGPAEFLQAHSSAVAEAMSRLLAPAAAIQPQGADAAQWANVAARLQSMWLEFQTEQALKASKSAGPHTETTYWFSLVERWYQLLPLPGLESQKRLWEDGLALWDAVLGRYGIWPKAAAAEEGKPSLPREDRRFADPKWSEHPLFALVHQTYLMLAEQVTAMADNVTGLDAGRKDQLSFAVRTLVDALSPANFLLTNPLVLERAIESKGESLIKGMEHLIADLRRGQLTHSDPDAFQLGENIAVTPGKVVHETPLYQLIQYSPTSKKVLATPLLIFPPWINRFYILDLNPQKSFVRWAVEQGVTVFMVSWKSADASMADVVWGDYIAAQIEAIDFVRDRLKVPAVHAIGYCVAGTTLAATLAVLARKGEADRVKSATFFTAQVDFRDSGDLRHFIDHQQIEILGALSPEGYLDGRYLAATFNMLRSNDLIWNYVVNYYLLGKEYPAFDLLHWNGDVTNLPAKWHQQYLADLYRDNRLVQPDSLSACGTPIDLRRITTPCYIQAGREDHIAPPESVWKLMGQLAGPKSFLLAGSGHIAGVVNPPAAGKYQFWTNENPVADLDQFIAGATERPGSWWPHWIEWLRAHDPAEAPATGRRKPGGKGDRVIEDAPGRYVQMR